MNDMIIKITILDKSQEIIWKVLKGENVPVTFHFFPAKSILHEIWFNLIYSGFWLLWKLGFIEEFHITPVING